jgi:hypothetical protein
MTVRYSGPDTVNPGVEARQAFYDALREVARPDYEDLARVGRAVSSVDPAVAMSSFSFALESFPAWFKERGFVPKLGFNASVFVNDALESMVQQAADGEPFKLRAYPWIHEGDVPSVEIECRIAHPMIKPTSTTDSPTEAQTWTREELRDSVVSLFTNQLEDWLKAIYTHAKETGVVSREALKLERDMKRLVQKQVLGYSPAEIVALEQGTQPSELEKIDHSDIRGSDKRAIAKSIDAAADRLGLEVVRLPPGPKPGRRDR